MSSIVFSESHVPLPLHINHWFSPYRLTRSLAMVPTPLSFFLLKHNIKSSNVNDFFSYTYILFNFFLSSYLLSLFFQISWIPRIVSKIIIHLQGRYKIYRFHIFYRVLILFYFFVFLYYFLCFFYIHIYIYLFAYYPPPVSAEMEEQAKLNKEIMR